MKSEAIGESPMPITETQTTGLPQILVADDDPAILRLIKAIVEKEGFTVTLARDGREAYKCLQSGDNFVAAILDVVMPHIQGTELTRFMQSEKRFKKIPVMMMTAEQNPRLSSESFAAGAVVFLPKPFTNNQLQVMLRMLIDKTRTLNLKSIADLDDSHQN